MDFYYNRVRKCCDLIFSALQLNIGVVDADWNVLVNLAHAHYPAALDPLWTDYYDKMKQALTSDAPFASYWHEVSDCSMIFLDIRLLTPEGEDLYVIIGPAMTRLSSAALDEILYHVNDLPAATVKQLQHFLREQPFFNSRTKSLFWFASQLFHQIDSLESFSISVPSMSQTFFAPSPVTDWKETQITEDQVVLNYETERKWRTFISMGDAVAARQAGNEFSDNDMTYRSPGNPFRIMKNLFISSNALARAAAYDGGAPAIEVHRLHEQFALQIEKVSTAAEIEELYTDMCNEYCRLVLETRTAQYSPAIRNAVTYIHTHYRQRITLQMLARELNYSEGHLSRAFQRETGKTLSAYLNELRIEHAQKLLLSHVYNITDAAFAVGFSSYEKFSIEFKKYTGMTASAYLSEKSGNHPN